LDEGLWLKTTINNDSGSGNHNGMSFKVCKKHNHRPQRVRQGCAVWVDVLCFNFSVREWGETLGATLKRVPPGLPKLLGRTLALYSKNPLILPPCFSKFVY